MRYVVASFLFFLISLPVVGQATYPLIEGPPPAKLAEASALVDSVKKSQSPVAMSIGGYALIQIKVTTKLTPYVVPGSNECLAMISIPKGKEHRGWFVPIGSKEFVYATIAADPDYDRLLVTGTVKGTATILWFTVTNGEATVVAAYQFDVAGGKPKPVPDDPVEPVDPEVPSNVLSKAAKADIKAGKGTADDVAAYANLYLMYGTEIKNGKTYTTTAELNKAMNAKIDELLGADIGATLPSLRRAVGAELVAKIPSITNPSTKIADIKTVLSEELLSIYKRLEGVK